MTQRSYAKISNGVRIIGIDPGTATTGYAIIQSDRGRLHSLEFGSITTRKTRPLAHRLNEVYRDLNKLILKYRPQTLVVESIFFYKNVKTAIAVAQARGVVLLCAEEHKLSIIELTPLQVKSSLTGYGKAEKKQVQYMVKHLLGLKNTPKPDDAADALALAICGANRNLNLI